MFPNRMKVEKECGVHTRVGLRNITRKFWHCDTACEHNSPVQYVCFITSVIQDVEALTTDNFRSLLEILV